MKVVEINRRLGKILRKWRRLQEKDVSPGEQILELRKLVKDLDGLYVWKDPAVSFETRCLHTDLRNTILETIEVLKYRQ